VKPNGKLPDVNIRELIGKETEKAVGDIIAWRRDLHRHPELGFQEHRTSEQIRGVLKKLGILFVICAQTGVVATVQGKTAGKTIAVRADMDALPINEETGLPFSSRNKGVMHACGHDAHTAILLGLARVISSLKDRLKGTVKFLFQPAEELPPGGAQKMLKEGIIGAMDGLIGFHNFPQLPLNTVWVGDGPVMAHTDQFEIVIKGKGGHGSTPHLTNDPIVCASAFVTAVQTIVSRRVDPFKESVLSVCAFNGGDAFNVIPDVVILKGTVRTLDDGVRRIMERELRAVLDGTTKMFGCSGKLHYLNYAPACVNDPRFSSRVRDILQREFPSSLAEYHPVMGGEDFAFFSRKIPSCYLFLGIGKESGHHHSSSFNLNERSLSFATNLIATLVCNLLISG